MSRSILIAEEHSWLRLAASRQLESRFARPIETCAPRELMQKIRQLTPDLVILGLPTGAETAVAVERCQLASQRSKILVILPGDESPDHQASFPTAATVSREHLSERLPQAVRDILPRRGMLNVTRKTRFSKPLF